MTESRVSPMAISPGSFESPIAAKNVSAHTPAGEWVCPRASTTEIKVMKLRDESLHIACRCSPDDAASRGFPSPPAQKASQPPPPPQPVNRALVIAMDDYR